jgi:hypothetical protein
MKIYEKLKNLHDVNGRMLAKVEKSLSKYGYECIQKDIVQFNG